MSDLYLHYREQVREANFPSDFNHIIESAFRDYVEGRITDKEYGKIYFACTSRMNEIKSAVRRRYRNERMNNYAEN